MLRIRGFLFWSTRYAFCGGMPVGSLISMSFEEACELIPYFSPRSDQLSILIAQGHVEHGFQLIAHTEELTAANLAPSGAKLYQVWLIARILSANKDKSRDAGMPIKAVWVVRQLHSEFQKWRDDCRACEVMFNSSLLCYSQFEPFLIFILEQWADAASKAGAQHAVGVPPALELKLLRVQCTPDVAHLCCVAVLDDAVDNIL